MTHFEPPQSGICNLIKNNIITSDFRQITHALAMPI